MTPFGTDKKGHKMHFFAVIIIISSFINQVVTRNFNILVIQSWHITVATYR